MKFDILTIFPEFFNTPFSTGVISKACQAGLVEINTVDIREYSGNKHRTVDDTPYGGGGGMLMKPEPLGTAIEATRDRNSKSIVVLTSPSGETYNDNLAARLAEYEQIVIVCGRYEGIDDRVRALHVDMEISIGDYILTGGEYAAAVIVDSVSRFIPGVLGNESSSSNDSFRSGLLEHPQYTRPEEYGGEKVPDVLLSGNHGDIERWRRDRSLEETFRRREDLLDDARLGRKDVEHIRGLKKAILPTFNVYIALVHYPVYNNRFNIITTAFTNLDVHDIARAAMTYGVRRFFLVQPNREQQQLIERVLSHWSEGAGHNKSRSEALDLVEIKNSVQDVISVIESAHGKKPKVIVTDARTSDDMSGYRKLRDLIFRSPAEPFLVLFGTGWGLTKEIMENADYILKPVSGYTDYNHLSVRSAAAIILDRLLSSKT